MAQASWSIQDAKAKFSTVVDAALDGVPQLVTRHGKPAVVVLSAETFERLSRAARTQAPSFSDLLLAMPQDDGAFEPMTARPRDLDL